MDQSDVEPHWDIPDAPVRTAEQSMATFDLPEGFRVELVAAEPLVEDPIAMDIGPDGRLWVVELVPYNWDYRTELPDLEHLHDAERPDGRIVILEDTTGDGRMDRRTVFLDGLRHPREVSVVGDGVLVADPPYVYYCRDTNGDGKADEQRRILDDFGEIWNPHAMTNGLKWAMDNWIYSIRYPYRLRWVDGEFERDGPIASRGQWGVAQDDFGRLYYGHQHDPLRGDLMPPAYWRANPHHGGRGGINERIGHDMGTWPQGPTPGVNRRVNVRDEDGSLRVFTSAAGRAIYRGHQYPEEFRGDAFQTVSAANFVRRFRIEEDADGRPTAVNAYGEEREFLFSHDERFRPVNIYNAPDGTLYVVDMYRGIIEGEISVTTYLRKQIIDRELQHPYTGLGRIYRIVYEGNEVSREQPGLHAMTAEQLVEQLSHASGWWRDTAQRLLVERDDASSAAALRGVVEGAERAATRAHALWTLEGIGELEADSVRAALADAHPRVRMAALRLAVDFVNDARVLEAVLALTDDERLDVRRMTLPALGHSDAEEAGAAMAALVARDADAPFVVDAAMSGARVGELAMLERLAAEEAWRSHGTGRQQFVAALAAATVRAGETDRIERLLAMTGDERDLADWMRVAVLEGVDAGAEGGLAVGAEAFAAALVSADSTVRERAMRIVTERIERAEEPADVDPTEGLSEGERQLYETGRMQYGICMACHGPDGGGMADVGPSLRESSWLGGEEGALVRMVLQGYSDDPDYPEMTPLGGLEDEAIAAILTYIRRNWGDAEPVSPATVERVREQTAERGSPWTAEELEGVR